MNIRRLTPADAAAFQALRLHALRESPTAFGASVEDEQSHSLEEVAASLSDDAGRTVFGAWNDTRLLGIVGVGRESGAKESHRGFVRGMYVAPEARAAGLGRALLQAALACARAMPGLRQLTLAVTAGNRAALALYEGAGFSTCGVTPQALQVDGVFHDEIAMVLDVAAGTAVNPVVAVSSPTRAGLKQLLVYADSLSWGIVPDTRLRLDFSQRWPGVLEAALLQRAEHGQRVRVIEDCLNGRRTVWDDPFKPGRNGLVGLAQRIEVNSPLALVVLMLGSNDFQSMHSHNAWHSAQGIAALVAAIRSAPIEPGMPVPQILVVAPPAIRTPAGSIAPKFEGGDVKCVGLPAAYAQVCEQLGCSFFDAGEVVQASAIDGVHLDAEQHAALGAALAPVVAALLAG